MHYQKSDERRIGWIIISALLVPTLISLFLFQRCHKNEIDPVPEQVQIMRTSMEPEIEARAEPVSISYNVPEAGHPDAADVDMLARLIWGEGRGVSEAEKAAIVWCVLNRVEDERWPGTVAEVVTQSGQFEGYSPEYSATQEHREIAERVLSDWLAGDDSRRALPREYVFFTGDGKRNTFRTEFRGGKSVTFGETEK